MAQIEEVIKNSKKVISEKIPCSIEVLTPVHIGSGVKLTEGIDFIKTEQSVQIVSQSELMQYLENNPDELDRFIKGNYNLNSLSEVPEGKTYLINIYRAREINEFERNGFGKPYIPGSSIKGSLRTIILKKIFDDLDENEKQNLLSKVNNPKKEWASEPIVKKMFGDDSNHNLMRTLEIFDAEFEDVDLSKVLILSLINDQGTAFGWKQMSRPPKNIDNPKYATSIYVEALPIGSKGYSSFSLNNFLFNNPVAKRELELTDASLSSINSLISTINNYTLEKLKSEKAFFEKLNSSKKLNELIKNIDLLINVHNALKSDEFIMRISWGSGWIGMTGDFIDNLNNEKNKKWVEIFRKRYQMGKKDFPIFPKTRRIVFEGDKSKYLTGWIKVKLNESKPNPNYNKENTLDTNKNVDTNDWAAKLGQKFTVKDSKNK
jgi:CRISPR-associated protein Csm5